MEEEVDEKEEEVPEVWKELQSFFLSRLRGVREQL